MFDSPYEMMTEVSGVGKALAQRRRVPRKTVLWLVGIDRDRAGVEDAVHLFDRQGVEFVSVTQQYRLYTSSFQKGLTKPRGCPESRRGQASSMPV